MHESRLPHRIGRFLVFGRLGSGTGTELLLGRQRGPFGFERTVVLKRLAPGGARDPAYFRVLAREAVAYARLDAPEIVRLHDFIAHEGDPVLVLEHIDGPSLAVLLSQARVMGHRLPMEAALFIGMRIFAALAAAHAAKDPRTGEARPVIHGDVSASNVLLPWDGWAKLTDFGIARGSPVTMRTDVHGACLVLRELLAGDLALPRGTPNDLQEAMRRGLEPSPEWCSITAAEMLAVLRRHVSTEPGRLALVRSLAMLHPVEVPSSLRPLAMTVPDATARVRIVRERPTIALLVGGILAAAFSIYLVGVRAPSPKPVRTAGAAPARHEPAPAPPRVKRLPPLEPAAPSSTLGVIQLPPRARGHRVWIDGSPAFEVSDDRVVICGPHTVRIGATGDVRTIQVPCGEVVDVE